MDVTRAILAAERSDTLEDWRSVMECEQALADALEPGTLQHNIAKSGVLSARRKVIERGGAVE